MTYYYYYYYHHCAPPLLVGRDRIRLLGFTRYTTSTLRSSTMLDPSHVDTKVRCTVMMIRPCKPRDSARPALLTAVRNRRSGLALHPPEGYLYLIYPLVG